MQFLAEAASSSGTFAEVAAAVFALGGAIIKVIEKNLGAAAAYIAVSLLALAAAIGKF